MDAVGRLVQHITHRGGCLHHLNVRFLFDTIHIRLTSIIGGDGGEQLPIRIHIKGGPGQGHAGLSINFQDGQANVADIFKCDGHISGAIPLYSLYTGILLVAFRAGLFPYPV